jgi:glutathione S-transferase
LRTLVSAARIYEHHPCAGNDLSLADISTGVFIYRLVEIDLKVILPDNVESWYQHLKHSNGYRQWVMSDFSSLKGRLEY